MDNVLDQISLWVGRAVAWLTVVMALLTVTIVVLRYAFDQGTIVLQETVMYLHGFAFMLAIPYALKEGAHVRVDLLYSQMSPQRQGLVDFCGHLFFLIPVSIFIFVTSLSYVGASWSVWETSSEVGGLPLVYVLKTLIPLMAALLFLQGLSELLRAQAKIRR